jgi:hypothetical protein
VSESAEDLRLFRVSAGAALCLHAWLLFGDPALSGGADLVPHLRLIEQMGEAPALRSVYPPAFHAAVATLAKLLGSALAVKLWTWVSAAALIAGFRAFQRASGLPVAAAALFAWTPYLFSLSWCLPKVEAAGYAAALAGLACLLRGRRAAAGAILAATFCIHTATALVFGLCGGLLALTRRDPRALVALAAGTLAASPLFAAHLAAGCTLREALLFSPGDYLRAAGRFHSGSAAGRIAILAGPLGMGAALLGAPRLWREHRDVAVVAGAIAALCASELWLAPFGIATTFNLQRALTLLSVAIAASAGVFAATRRGLAPAFVAASAAFALVAAVRSVPGSCHREPVVFSRVAATRVERCSFRWHFARELPPPRAPRVSPRPGS